MIYYSYSNTMISWKISNTSIYYFFIKAVSFYVSMRPIFSVASNSQLSNAFKEIKTFSSPSLLRMARNNIMQDRYTCIY